MSSVRILVADDHEVVRRGVKSLLESHPGWTVVAEAATGREAVDQVKRCTPDVVILDITMPELNGLEATRQILKSAPQTEILILTLHESAQLIRCVLEAGARGYVLKSDAGRNLIDAVEAVSEHKAFFTSNVAATVLDGYLKSDRRKAGVKPDSHALTPREREIIQLLAEGKSNKEVATTLGISVHTAETHRTNIMRKLEVHSVSELVRYAIRQNIVSP